MPSNFPNNPVVGQTHTIGNIVWEWDGIAWIAVGAPALGVFLFLNDLSDVDITTNLTTDSLLKYDGLNWISSNNLDGGTF